MSEQERSVPATQRRMERAHEQMGAPVRRTPVAAGALLLGALGAWLGGVPHALLSQVREGLAQAGAAGAAPGGGAGVRSIVLGVLLASWPALLGGVLGAVLGTLVQTGFRVRAPGSGLRARLQAPAAAAAGAVARLGWAIALGACAAVALAAQWKTLAALPAQPLALALRGGAEVAVRTVLAALVAAVALAVVDLWWARRRWEHALRMTPEEAREERRAGEGDPALRARRHAAARRVRAAATATRNRPAAGGLR